MDEKSLSTSRGVAYTRRRSPACKVLVISLRAQAEPATAALYTEKLDSGSGGVSQLGQTYSTLASASTCCPPGMSISSFAASTSAEEKYHDRAPSNASWLT